jgi:hypothetical protein
MGVALIIAAMAIFFRCRIRDYALARADNPTRTRRSGPITVVFGAVLGLLVSLYSVGAGALGVAVLFFLYPRLSPVRIVGSDLAHAVPLTIVAGLGHWLIGSVDWCRKRRGPYSPGWQDFAALSPIAPATATAKRVSPISSKNSFRIAISCNLRTPISQSSAWASYHAGCAAAEITQLGTTPLFEAA